EAPGVGESLESTQSVQKSVRHGGTVRCRTRPNQCGGCPISGPWALLPLLHNWRCHRWFGGDPSAHARGHKLATYLSCPRRQGLAHCRGATGKRGREVGSGAFAVSATAKQMPVRAASCLR